MRVSRGLAALGLGLALAGCAVEPLPRPPMPPDLRVVPPPLGVPRDHARYSGRWVGKWNERLDHVLVVELQVPTSDQTTEVIAVYSWGVSADLGVGAPGWSRVRGRIQDGALWLDLTRVQATAIYALQADGTLMGEYRRGETITSRVRMTRGTPREDP